VLEQLRGLFSFAVDRHLLTVNPAAKCGEKDRRYASVNRTLSADEIRRHLDDVKIADRTSQPDRVPLIPSSRSTEGQLVRPSGHIDLNRSDGRSAGDSKTGDCTSSISPRRANSSETHRPLRRRPMALPAVTRRITSPHHPQSAVYIGKSQKVELNVWGGSGSTICAGRRATCTTRVPQV
jgi:hypothetical protein